MYRLTLNDLLIGWLCCCALTLDQGIAAQEATKTGQPEHECLQRGDAVGAFYVTKIAGAQADGVEPGAHLCYRCRYGSSPMVMVFARRTDGRVPQLVKELNSAVARHSDSKLRGLFTLLGEDAAELKDTAKELAGTIDVEHLPIVIAENTKTGPPNYRLPGDIEVTIVLARDSQTVVTHTSTAAGIELDRVMTEVKAILN